MKLAYRFGKAIYAHLVGAATCVAHLLSGPLCTSEIRVNYGGVRSGNRGGPQVKAGLLRHHFPECFFGFNILYLLSGSLHMPPWAVKILKKRGVKLVLNQNGVFYPDWCPEGWRQGNKKMADILALSDHVFYQSEFCKKSADRFLGEPVSAHDVLYNGVDTNFFKIGSWHKSERFRFLVTGNIGESTFYRLADAVDSLLSARHAGLDVEILFAGHIDESCLIKIKADIKEKFLESFFMVNGEYTRNDAPSIFSSADAYLITKHNDPCPNVVLEAMACGLPVLYSASGGIPELVGDAGVSLEVAQTFKGHPVPSVDAIVDGMRAIMVNRDSMSRAARTRAVDIFDIKHWIDHQAAVFNQLIRAS